METTVSMINPNKMLWEKGDFTRIAQTMRTSGENLVSKLKVSKGMRILDLGCGDGTTAIPMARLGAVVTGVDIARNLVTAGKLRAQLEKLENITFQEGDACNLEGLDDNHFDVVISIFGAMFAPRPLDVAREMLRVTKTGGRIVMGNWIPNDPTLVAQILRISSAYTPAPPAGFVSPMLWGVEQEVVNRFVQAGAEEANISFSRETYRFEFSGSPGELVKLFKTYYGPTMNAFEAAEKHDRVQDLQRELEELFMKENISGHPAHTIIPATFLQVTVVK